jgi:hypothetical protein
LVLLAGFIGAAIPWIRRQGPASRQAEALNNLRQIGTALFEFDSKYGTFPDNNTAEDLMENTGSPLVLSGSYSNDYFRQLILENLATEEAFWCETSFSPKRPDNRTDSPTRARSESLALSAGEVGFSYIMASKTEGQSSAGDPRCALVVAPSYQAHADWTFDPKPFGGKTLVLNIDNSVGALRIDPDRRLPEHSLFFDYVAEPGESSPWGWSPPVLRSPLPGPSFK